MTETQYRLERFYEVTLDVTGAASIFNIGPTQANERWEINKYSVKTDGAPATIELIDNGGFEVDTSGWTTTAPGTLARSTTQHRTGVACAFFDPVSGGDMRTSIFYRYLNITYNVSLYAIHSVASNRLLTAGYAYYDSNQSFLGSAFPIVNAAVPATNWDTQFTYTVPNNLGSNVEYFRPVFGSNLSIFVDDVSVSFATGQFIGGTFQVFRGNSQDSAYQIDYTETPSGDISPVNETVRTGEYLSVKWTNGPPGARGTFRLEGLSIVPGKRAY